MAVKRFLYCRGLALVGREDQVATYRRAVVNGSIFSCVRMAKSKLKNSYTVQYEDAKGQTQFGEIQRFLVLSNHHVAVVTKLDPSGSLTSRISSSSDLLNNLSNSYALVHHVAVNKRSKSSFCVPLINIKRLCIVVSTCGEDVLTISTFPNLVEHD